METIESNDSITQLCRALDQYEPARLLIRQTVFFAYSLIKSVCAMKPIAYLSRVMDLKEFIFGKSFD